MIDRLTEKQAIIIHQKMLDNTGGSNGVRDEGLLLSALNAPFQTFGGKELYPSILLKASVMCRSIVCNHPFVDGNKRTGVHCMLLFLDQNGIEFEYTQQELIEFGFAVANGKLDVNSILNWLLEHRK